MHELGFNLGLGLCAHDAVAQAFVYCDRGQIVRHAGLGEIIFHHNLGIELLVKVGSGQNGAVQCVLQRGAVPFDPHEVDPDACDHEYQDPDIDPKYDEVAIFVTPKASRATGDAG